MNQHDDQDDQTSDQGTDDHFGGAAKVAGEEAADQVPDAGNLVAEDSADAPKNPDDGNGESSSTDEETFDRAYVEDLRKESAGYRTQLRTVQEQLHRLQVEQTGKLADPADLAFDPAHLDDPDALSAAIDGLLESKPHLKARRFDGSIGQGEHGTVSADVNLAEIMRARL